MKAALLVGLVLCFTGGCSGGSAPDALSRLREQIFRHPILVQEESADGYRGERPLQSFKDWLGTPRVLPSNVLPIDSPLAGALL